MAPRGGGFGALIGTLELYGLVETGGGEVRITELGKSFAYETDEAMLQETRSKVIKRVELFSDYFSQYGNEVTEDKVRAFLRSKGGVDVTQLPQISGEISKLLINVLPNITNGSGARVADEQEEVYDERSPKNWG